MGFEIILRKGLVGRWEEEGGKLMRKRLSFSSRRYHVYAWGISMHLFIEVLQILTINYHGLMHMGLVGASQNTIPLSMVFHNKKGLDNFTMVQKKYN